MSLASDLGTLDAIKRVTSRATMGSLDDETKEKQFKLNISEQAQYNQAEGMW